MSDKRVDAFDPSGQLVTIPEEQALDAQLQGYELATPEAMQARALEAEHGGDNVRAGLEGVARGATLGLSDYVQAKGANLGTRLGNALADLSFGDSSGVDRDAQAVAAEQEAKAGMLGRQQANSTISTIGEMGGAIGLGVLTGGLGAEWAAGKAAARLGQAAATTLGKASIRAGLGAVEGAAFGAAKAVDDDFLADRDITAERIALAAGEGALLGGALAGGASLLGSGLKEGARRLSGALGEGSSVGGYLDKMAGESAYKAAVGRTSKQSMKLADRQGGAEAVGKTLLEEGIDLTLDAESILSQTTAKADEIGETISRLVQEADALGEGVKRGDLQEVIKKSVIDPLNKVGTQDLARRLESSLDDMGITRFRAPTDAPVMTAQRASSGVDPMAGSGLMGVPEPKPSAYSGGGLMGEVVDQTDEIGRVKTLSPTRSRSNVDSGLMGSAKEELIAFSEINGIRKALDARLKWSRTAPDELLDAKRDVRRAIDRFFLDKVDEAAQQAGKPEFVKQLKEAKRKYAHLALARDQAQEAVQTQLANRATSLTDTLAGVGAGATTGGPVGFLAGIATSQAHRFVRERGRGVLATAIFRARQRAMRGEELIEGAAGGMIGAVTRGFQRATKAAEVASDSVPIGGVVMNTRDPASYEGAIQHLMRLQDRTSEERRKLHERNAELAAESPEHAAAIDAHTQRTIDFLLEKAGPSSIDPSRPFGHLQVPKHARATALQLARYAQAAQAPQSALERIADGKHTKEDVETLKALYPRLWSRFGAKVRSQLADLKKPPSYRTRLELGRILEQPMSDFDSPAFQQAAAAARGAAQSKEAQAQQPQSRSTTQLARSGAGHVSTSDRILARSE